MKEPDMPRIQRPEIPDSVLREVAEQIVAAETRPTVDTATRDRIAAGALRWAADRIDPGPRATRPKPVDETHDATMCADRGTATNLRFWADQVERGYIEPRPAGAPA